MTNKSVMGSVSNDLCAARFPEVFALPEGGGLDRRHRGDRHSPSTPRDGVRMRFRLHALLVPVAATATVLVPTTTAHATGGYDRCPDGSYCMFSGLDGDGDMIKLTGDTPNLATVNMDNRAQSDWNRTSSDVHLWSNANYTGCTTVTSAGPTGQGNFAPAFRAYFSSVRFGGPGEPRC